MAPNASRTAAPTAPAGQAPGRPAAPPAGVTGGAPGAVQITTTLAPDAPIRNGSAQLTVVLESSGRVAGAALAVSMPPGTTVRGTDAAPATPLGKLAPAAEPPDARTVVVALPEFQGRLVRTFSLQGAGGAAPRGPYRVPVDLWAADTAGGRRVVAQSAPLVTFAPELSLAAYLWFGVFGIVVGYAVRYVRLAQASVPVPNAAPLQDGEPATTLGWLGRWIAAQPGHYYFVDALVTLALGVAALLALLKDGHLPDAGASWYGTLLLGFGLGLLTNSELVTKLPGR